MTVQSSPQVRLRKPQTSISQKTRKNAFGTSTLVPNWVQGVQVGNKNRPKIDQKMESKIECILASIFNRSWSIFGAKLGWEIDQKMVPKSAEKKMQKRRDLDGHRGPKKSHLGASWGLRPPGIRLGAGSARARRGLGASGNGSWVSPGGG